MRKLFLGAFCALAAPPIFAQTFRGPVGSQAPGATYSLAEGAPLQREIADFIDAFPAAESSDPLPALESLVAARRSEASVERKAALTDVLHALIGEPSASVARMAEAGLKRPLWEKIQAKRTNLFKSAKSRPELAQTIESAEKELPGPKLKLAWVAPAEPPEVPKSVKAPARPAPQLPPVLHDPRGVLWTDPAVQEVAGDGGGQLIDPVWTDDVPAMTSSISHWRNPSIKPSQFFFSGLVILERHLAVTEALVESKSPLLTPRVVRNLSGELGRTSFSDHLPADLRKRYAEVKKKLDAAFPLPLESAPLRRESEKKAEGLAVRHLKAAAAATIIGAPGALLSWLIAGEPGISNSVVVAILTLFAALSLTVYWGFARRQED
jgi:hypothetical protein